MNCEFEDKIFTIDSAGFNDLTLAVFQFQAANNRIYSQYLSAIGCDPGQVKTIGEIPFLPISFFKTHEVMSGEFIPETIFESSGTTSTINSRHYLKSKELYRKSFTAAFRHFYGEPAEWCIIGLLPSYLERSSSSLVMMVDALIKSSGHGMSGFYLYDHDTLYTNLLELENQSQKTLLIGVSFALLDFAEKYEMKFNHVSVMETGGMKGRRAEITRMELHNHLKNAFGLASVHSEYGMTELLSQAYSRSDGQFQCPAWMKLMVREDDDPLSVNTFGKGMLNVIDLANLYSCSFIATDDIGVVYENGSFEVQGRMDNSDIRGCSLMVSEL